MWENPPRIRWRLTCRLPECQSRSGTDGYLDRLRIDLLERHVARMLHVPLRHLERAPPEHGQRRVDGHLDLVLVEEVERARGAGERDPHLRRRDAVERVALGQVR